MKRDPELSTTVRQKVMKAAWGADPMVICEAVASTSKNHTREGRNGWPENATARITAVRIPQGNWSPTVKITVWQPETPEPQNHDARTLAAECMSWWKSFLKKNELSFPWEGT